MGSAARMRDAAPVVPRSGGGPASPPLGSRLEDGTGGPSWPAGRARCFRGGKGAAGGARPPPDSRVPALARLGDLLAEGLEGLVAGAVLVGQVLLLAGLAGEVSLAG